jgi:hypothetical protein
MMPLEVGKLYSCSKYFLMLYPDRETATHAAAAHAAAHDAERHAAYWTKKLQKPVSFCNPETPLLVLAVEEKYVEVLAGDKVGWAICQDWLELKEIVHEAA